MFRSYVRPAFQLSIAVVLGISFAALSYAAPVPIHRYSFSEAAGAAPDGTVVADSIGGANGVIRGAGSTLTGSKVRLPGGGNFSAGYVDLPNGLIGAAGASTPSAAGLA